jgi:NAD(P)-dependent dehydrogenase (short-subunit alcohol dehydrogenase family)
VDAVRPIDILVNNAGNAGSARLALAPLVETKPSHRHIALGKRTKPNKHVIL